MKVMRIAKKDYAHAEQCQKPSKNVSFSVCHRHLFSRNEDKGYVSSHFLYFIIDHMFMEHKKKKILVSKARFLSNTQLL